MARLIALRGWIVVGLTAAVFGVSVASFAAESGGGAEHAVNAGAESGGHAAEDPHAAPGNAHGNPNPLVIGPDLALVTAIVFLLLLAVLGKFAWRPILEALDRRERMIADSLAAAEAKQEEATRLLAQYEAKLRHATDQVRAMLDEARRDAEYTKSEIIAEARAAAQSEQERALREVRLATDASLKQLSETSANLAVDLASKILEQKLSDTEHDRLVRDALAGMPSAN
jgi:F-type H+-transporting ATPase subunit b